MLPAVFDLEIYQGDTYSLPIRLGNTDANGVFTSWIDLTSYTGKAQIRASATASAVIVEFTVTNDADQVTNRGMTTLSLTATQTAALPVGTFVWDFQATVGSTVNTYLKGSVVVDAEITR